MRTVIHVNQHVIKANRKHGKTDPVLTCKTYKSNKYGHELHRKSTMNGKEKSC
jgi:hypothetical protein